MNGSYLLYYSSHVLKMELTDVVLSRSLNGKYRARLTAPCIFGFPIRFPRKIVVATASGGENYLSQYVNRPHKFQRRDHDYFSALARADITQSLKNTITLLSD